MELFKSDTLGKKARKLLADRMRPTRLEREG
jgi:hypothetical protein